MESHIEQLLQRCPALTECAPSLQDAISLLATTFEDGGKLLLCGNGGSAADCEHIVGELMKGFLLPRRISAGQRKQLSEMAGPAGETLADNLQGALPAIALTSHVSLTTAVANDNGDGLNFAQHLYGLGRSGDALLGISTSGNAKNVLNAFHVAKLLGIKTVLLTGRTGGVLAPLADVAIRVPADRVFEIQEFHLPIYHTLCIALEAHFFGRE